MINFLSFFIGFDKKFLKKNSNNLASVFFFFFSYMLLFFLSLYGFFNVGLMLSENFYIAVFASLFLTYILHNMYMLILATSYDGNNLKNSKQILKYISTKGFLVIILAFVISASIATELFNKDIEVDLNDYKQNELIVKFTDLLNISFNNQIEDLKSKYQDEKELAELLNISLSNKDSLTLIQDLNNLEIRKKSKINDLLFSVNRSNFFIQKIRIVSSKFKFWMLTFFILALFLLPLYLFNTSTFFLNYQLNIINNNNKLVLEEYSGFKSNYSNIYLKSIGEPLNVVENHLDPPFNNNKIIREEKILKKGSLLKWLNKYNA